MRQKKRSTALVAAFLGMAMIVGLAACGSLWGKDPAPAPSGSGDYSKKLVISYAAVAMAEGVDYNGDELSRHFLEKFNIEWRPIYLTWDNWGEKIRIWINSGEVPDFVMWEFNYGEYMNYTSNGLIRRLPEGWKERWPNMARVYANTGIAGPLEEKVGGAYMIPRVTYFDMPTDPLVSHKNLWIRQDWARDVGFEVKEKYSAAEIMEFARLLKEADPAGGGRTIPIDMEPDNLALFFVSPYNVQCDGFYKDETGRYVWGAAEESTLEGLKLYSQAYREGLIDPDFFSLKNNEELSHYYSGIAGVTYYQGLGRSLKLVSKRYEVNAGGDPKADLHMAYLVGEDGRYHSREIFNYWGVSIFSPNMEEEKFERLMDLLEYSASEEGQDLIRMGFEGKDWEYGGDGGVNILRQRDKDGNFVALDTIYPSLDPLYNNLTILPDSFDLKDPSLDQEFIDTVDARFAGKQRDGCDQGAIAPIDWDLTFFTSPGYEKAKLDYGDEFAKLVVMDGDIEANWRAWVAEKTPQMSAVLDELNAAFAD